jgi:hypothetical protein
VVSVTDPYGRILVFLDQRKLCYQNKNLRETGGRTDGRTNINRRSAGILRRPKSKQVSSARFLLAVCKTQEQHSALTHIFTTLLLTAGADLGYIKASISSALDLNSSVFLCNILHSSARKSFLMETLREIYVWFQITVNYTGLTLN